MSRGGFRGRGRGRGGGSSGPTFGARDSMELTKGPLPYSGMLYPPLDPSQVATLSNPTDFEEIIMQKTLELDEVFRKGLPGNQIGEGATPWRLKETRKVVGIEIETWADRQTPQVTQAGPSTLNPSVLYMDESFFPPGLWREHVDGPRNVAAGSGNPGKRKRRILSDDEDDKPDIEEDKSDAASSAEEDFDFEDDDSEHQDYEANYFDNGEGEDDESGGEGDEGGFDND